MSFTIKVLKKPKVVDLCVYRSKNSAGHWVIHVDGMWKGKRHIGYGQVCETTNNTSKALADFVMKAMPDELVEIGKYASSVKMRKFHEDTGYPDSLYGLYINLNNNKVMIEDRVGMVAVKSILAKMGWDVKVHSHGHIISRIILEEIV